MSRYNLISASPDRKAGRERRDKMEEIKFNNGKIGVIVEIADIFFAQEKYDSYLPIEYETEWDEKEKEIFDRWEKGKQKNLKLVKEKKKEERNKI